MQAIDQSMTPLALFDKYEINMTDGKRSYTLNGRTISTLDGHNLSGAIAFTADRKSTGWLHKLIYLVQITYYKLFGKKSESINPALMHGVIIVQKEAISDKFTIAHSVFSGIKTGIRDYPSEQDVTGMVIYCPKDQQLQQAIKDAALQTSFTPQKHRKAISFEKYNDQMGGFSIPDMVKSLFSRQSPTTYSDRVKKRLSFAVADLAKGNVFLDRKGKPKSYFCTPYALTVVQSALLLQTLTAEEKQYDRESLANHVFKAITGSEKNRISECFNACPLLQLDGRYAMTAFTAHVLDQASK